MKPHFSNIFSGLSVLICLKIGLSKGDDEFESVSTLTVEHSFDPGPNPVFSKRGTITIRSLKSGVAHFSQDAPLDDFQQEKLKSLVESDGTYHLRIPTKSGSPVPHVSTFIKACALYETDLTDVITLNVDQTGSVLGVSLSSPIPYCQGLAVDDISTTRFTSNVEVIQTSQGPAPETQTYIQKLEAEKAEKAKGQQTDNRSFFAKYWMYLVPLFIFLMFASNADPNQGGGGGGR